MNRSPDTLSLPAASASLAITPAGCDDLVESAEPAENTPRLPGDLAIWVFIVAELLAFALLFSAYALTRVGNIELFDTYQRTLDRNAGALNTVLLITGSWFVVLAAHAVKRDQSRQAANLIGAGFLCGFGFLLVKILEYKVKFAAGIGLSTNTFYMFYILLTFFHFMHVILGMVILSILWVKTRRGAYGPYNFNAIESGAAYWHMVDLVWIVLFPLVYVIH